METRVKSEIDSNRALQNENLKCWNAGSNPLCLRIELSDGTQFILPYGYFEGAKLRREPERESVILQFKAHEFTVRGVALAELFAAFQTLSVEWIKEYPRRYQALASKAQGFIEGIEVKTAEDRRGSAPISLSDSSGSGASD
jgi:hypothetical protein